MMKQLRRKCGIVGLGAVLLALAGGGAGCSNAPGTVYQLTPDQLAWQPYQVGQQLRFGNAGSPVVRTYRILSVEDELFEGPHSNGLVVVPLLRGKDPDQYQNILVTAVRSDTISGAFEALNLAADPSYSITSAPDTPVYAQAAWSIGSAARLPIAEINQGIAFDTLGVYQHTRLLPSLTLGSATYAQVVWVRQPGAVMGPAALYYARGAGLVGFVERKTGLWYRLP